MNQEIIPYYKWQKLSKADRDEFKYKFEDRLDNSNISSSDMGYKIILSMLVIVGILIATSIFTLIGEQMVFNSMIPFGIIALLVTLVEPISTAARKEHVKREIDKWLEDKGV